MFSNLFTSSPAVWSGLIAAMVALPILIHLINLVRHRTIEWAAMEFLLKSHRKNRNWVWLKQFLLLLSRILILLLALFMLSQIGCENDRIAAMLGGNATHHYVLVDDSFSMSDRDTTASAMDRARSTVMQIVQRAKGRQNQRFTMLRYSGFEQAGSSAVSDLADVLENESSDDLIATYDIENEIVDSAFELRLETAATALTASAFSCTADRAIETATQLIRSREQENAIVYVVSDFRKKDFGDNSSTISKLQELADAGAAIELIRCAKTVRQNLAVTKLAAVSNVRVAETPLMMEVEVRNVSDEVANKVQLRIESSVYDSEGGSAAGAVEIDELPSVFIEQIEPRETATRRFPVYFDATGQHGVTATLEQDAVAVDNLRFSSLEIKSQADVLLIDDADRKHSTFLALAMNPNQSTGIRSTFKMTDYLRDAAADELDGFDVIYLCDVAQLDDVAVKNLETFVQRGGGLVFFVGPNTNFSFWNLAFYKGGAGLSPVELEESIEIDERIDGDPADIVPETHPIFAPVSGVGNSLLDLVQVKRVVQPTFQWLQQRAVQSKVIATVRGDRQLPLVVEGQYGKGRTMVFLSTVGPMWNNWMRNATFPPILLLLEDYMAAGQNQQETLTVGRSIQLNKIAGSVTPDVVSLAPSRIAKSNSEAAADRLERKIRLESVGSKLTARIGSEAFATNRETRFPGVYEFVYRQTDASSSTDRVALNVDTDESDLELVNETALGGRLQSSVASINNWDQFNPEPQQKPASSLNRFLLLMLILFLVAEQTLAWSCSYHS